MSDTAAPALVRRPHRRIQASRGMRALDLGEIWRFRELLVYLVWREIKSRYKQTYLGASWAIVRPFVMMVVFVIIFGRVAGIDPGTNLPYALFVFAGVLPWLYFQSAVVAGSLSLLNSGSLISKAYFPRLYVPLGAVAAPLVDFVLGFTILLGLFAWFQFVPGWQIVLAPLFLLFGLLVAFAVALWLSGIAVRYRDISFALPFVAQIWFFLTPIIYPVTLVPERFRWLLALNPMTAVIEGARWSLLGKPAPDMTALAVSAPLTVVLVVAGLYAFRRTERTIVDMI